MLIAEQVTKAYGEAQVLRGINLSVAPGRLTVVLGTNGSGKSTLLRELAFVETPDSGRVTLDGHAFGAPGAPRPWPTVSAVFQQLYLWPHLTIGGNLTLACRHLRVPEWEADFARLAREFTLGALLHRFPNQLSLGERQRAALVRALLVRPRYLLLDEVTSALDVEQSAVALDVLRAARDQGVGILLVTHLLGFARREADRVVFLDNGVVAEEGPRTLLHAPATAALRRLLSLWN